MTSYKRWQQWWNRLGLLLLAVYCLGRAMAAERPAEIGPRRVVTRYALTATHDYPVHDPTAWRLLGSNDDGLSWTVLDVRTNEPFGARSERRVFRISNRNSFSLYRLQIDRVSWQDQEPIELDRSVQLADIELIGPVTSSGGEALLDPLITSSEAHPLVGPAENAFDNDPTTRWLDFGLAHGRGTWIQCQYGGGSRQALTNLNQVQLQARVAAARETWIERAPRIFSNLTAYARQPVLGLTGYALTSANDTPGRDPRDWRVLGSNNEGKNWTLLDQRKGETFSGRFQRRLFTVTNQTPFAWYRLEITAVRLPGNLVQLAEFEPFPWKKETVGPLLVVLAKADNPPMEAIEMAFDGDPKTKWLSFASTEVHDPNWIQWQYLPAETDLPLLNRNQIDRWAEQQRTAALFQRAGKPVRSLTGYALTSANDSPPRDPRDWRLWGSRDEGQTWDLLDTRRNEEFPARFQRRAFSLVRPVAYPLYRLQFDAVAQPGEANSVQLGELEPLVAAGETNRAWTLLITAQGENPPRETVELAFDNNPATKWLDFARDTNRSSWIEWQYADVASGPASVVNLDRLRAAQERSKKITELRLEAVAVSYDNDSRRLGLIDGTGFQLLELGRHISIQPGQRVRLSGPLLLDHAFPRLPQPELAPLGFLPDTGDLGSTVRFQPGLPALSGTVQGRATGIALGQHYTTIRLTTEAGNRRIQARILGESHLPLPSPLDCRLRVQGVIEPLLNEQQDRVPGIVWVSSLDAVELAPPTEQEWNQWPEQSISDLWRDNHPWAQLVRVRGTVSRQLAGGGLVLESGTNHLTVYARGGTPLPVGSAAESAGFCIKEEGQPVLRLAQYRAAVPRPGRAPTIRTNSHEQEITQWHQLQQLTKDQPEREWRVRLRGTLTYIDLALADFYLQNGNDAIQCSGQFNAGLSPFLRQEGTCVEVQGIVRQNVLYPTAFAQVLGKGQLPRPLRHSWDYMMTGKDDGRWVEVEGVVSAVERQRLTLKVPGGQLVAWVNDLDHRAQGTLLGSSVRASGVCSSVFNSRRQRLGLRLLVPSGDCLELANAAPEDPFALPTLPIGRVMQDEPNGTELPTQLVKTMGIVTHRQPRLLFIQDGTDGLRVQLLQDTRLEPGDKVEVVGLPEPDGFSPKLTQAVARRLGAAPLPPAQPIDLLSLDSSDLQEQRDATRGQMEAVLTAVRTSENLKVLEVQHPQTLQTFSAFLPTLAGRMPALLPGSLLRLEGVFKARRDAVPDVDQPVTAFEMFLNTPADITILSRPSWWTVRHTVWVLGGLGTALLLVLSWVGSLHNQVRQRTRELHEEIEDRKRAQTQLEMEIAERERMRAQVEKTHNELLVASRQAGMAEVATSVLHNVGNVLNSVNVSTSLLHDKLRKSKAANLLRAAAMIRDHETDLGEFLTQDVKGRQLPGYLVQVAEHLAGEQAEAQREVQELSRNVEHIKDIVAMQQNYARVSGVAERLHLPDLAEDALRMNAGALARHDVQVTREYSPNLPEVTVDKHKVLQVLVNLIRNAKYACDESGRQDKRLTVRITHADDRVRVAIIDNGVGIPAENLTRIFNYGFTTRKNGHGFGLHSSALAAKEMGGSLQAQSEGPGQGASFTLDLPLNPKT